MKFTKKALALVLALVMVGSLASVLAFAGYDMEATSEAYEVDDNVFHTSYEVTSGENGNTVTAQALEFDPADGYVPVVYAANAGSVSLLHNSTKLNGHFDRASIERWGYEPVGVINGSFFNMSNGFLNGINITDGRITCAHVGYTGEMVTFDSKGVMTVVKSSLDYKLYANGNELKNALTYINKRDKGTAGDKVYYWDSACGTISDSQDYEKGVEVLCNKVNNTELSVGGTLVGEVVSVGTDTNATGIGTNQFVLYCKSSSPFADTLKNLKAGSEVQISVNESIEESREVMENCSSAIENIGWLVKDGVDQTQIKSEIGTHSVTLQARWTAFGTKPDGSYVFFTTEGGSTGAGGSVTLRDVAKAMMELGCNNVIRMDGGGSSAMYLADAGNGEPGYVQSSSRSVSDCIMVVKLSSMLPSEELVTALDAAIAKGEEAEESANITLALEAAKAVRADERSTEGDYKRAIMKISAALAGKQELQALVAKAANVKFTEYSQFVLDNLRVAYDAASTVVANKEATAKEIKDAYNELLYWYSLSGDQSVNVAFGKDYTSSSNSNASYVDTDGVELTDGALGNGVDAHSPTWAGYNGASGGKYEYVIDLGEKFENISSFGVNALQLDGWGIAVPKNIKVYVSDDNTAWTEAASLDISADIYGSKEQDAHDITVKPASAVSGRYVKFELTAVKSFIFISELSVNVDFAAIDEGLYLTAFNTSILADYTSIFTSGTITGASHNPLWTHNIWLEWNEALEAYVVTKNVFANGSFADYTLKEGEIIIAVHRDSAVADMNRTLAQNAKVGDILVLNGIDIEKLSTDIGAYFYFEDGYKPGDVNMNGEIDATDYLIIRQTVLGLVELDKEQTRLADVNGNGKIDANDYVMVKRHFLGTYNIKGWN
ncbi:MAG: phosphodiester glycosidase family protein [Clostridia bacterium]|nr:phosphodiester glycosidase family protein [Clostridia bacterium]